MRKARFGTPDSFVTINNEFTAKSLKTGFLSNFFLENFADLEKNPVFAADSIIGGNNATFLSIHTY